MNRKEQLFLLISSMDKQEKRYFRLHALQHGQKGEKRYMDLFNLICKMKEYDESLIRRKFRGEAFIKQLHVAKHYLQKILLRSMHSYHLENSADSRVKMMLHQISILFNKGLFSLCLDLLGKAGKICEQTENFSTLVEVYNWKRKVLNALHYEGIRGKEFTLLQRQVEKSVVRLQNMNRFSWHHSAIYFKKIKQERFIRTRRELRKFHDDISVMVMDPFFSNEKNASSVTAKAYFHHTMGLYHFMIEEAVKGKRHATKAYSHYSKLLGILENAPDLSQEHFDIYFSTLNNMVVSCIRLGRHSEAFGYTARIRDLKPAQGVFKVQVFLTYCSAQLYLYLVTSRFREAESLVREIEEQIDRFGKRLSRQNIFSLYFNIARLYFEKEDYRASLNYINKILNDPSCRSHHGIYVFSRIIELLIHYELRNNEVLPYLVRSLYRFLRSRQRLFRFEILLLTYLRKFPGIQSGQQLIQVFTQLGSELKKLMQDPFERQVLEYFDFVAWVEKKKKEKNDR